MQRFIIYSKADGTYIGATYGGPFFSGYAGSTFKNSADTFATDAEAREYASRSLTGEDFPTDLQMLAVQTDAEQATMDECIAAGVAPWEHHIARLASDPDCYSRPFSMKGFGNAMVIGPACSGKSAAWPWLGIQALPVDADVAAQQVVPPGPTGAA